MESDKKRPKTRKKKSWLDPVAGATDEEYRKMKRRVFNAQKLLPRATELDLLLIGNARAGSPANQFLTSWDDPLVPDEAKEIRPPWVGTDYEAPLRKTKLDGKRATVFPLSGLTPEQTAYRHEQFWNVIYGQVGFIGKLYKDDRPAALSRDAAKRRRIAQKLDTLAGEIEPYSPRILPHMMRGLARTLARDAAWTRYFAKKAQGGKRHGQHPATRRILELMDLVHHETGRWHDKELAALLNIAGLKDISPKSLQDYRRHSPYFCPENQVSKPA